MTIALWILIVLLAIVAIAQQIFWKLTINEAKECLAGWKLAEFDRDEFKAALAEAHRFHRAERDDLLKVISDRNKQRAEYEQRLHSETSK